MAGLLGKVFSAGANVVRRVLHAREISAVKGAVEASTHGAKVKAGDVTFIPGAKARYIESPVSARYSGTDAKISSRPESACDSFTPRINPDERIKELKALAEKGDVDAWIDLERIKRHSETIGLQALADKGDVDAMLKLAGSHCQEAMFNEAATVGFNGVINNKAKQNAEYFYAKAAQLRAMAVERGNTEAMTALSCMYANGQGVPKNIKKEFGLLKDALRISLSRGPATNDPVKLRGFAELQSYASYVKGAGDKVEPELKAIFADKELQELLKKARSKMAVK